MTKQVPFFRHEMLSFLSNTCQNSHPRAFLLHQCRFCEQKTAKFPLKQSGPSTNVYVYMYSTPTKNN